MPERTGLSLPNPNGTVPCPEEVHAADTSWLRALELGGEMGRRILAFDWSKTPIGPIESWPLSLRLMVNLCVRSRIPTTIYWGPEFILLYNDATRNAIGLKDPAALGQPGSVLMADLWDQYRPVFTSVLTTGEATWSEDVQVLSNRRGIIEESYQTYSISPIPDGAGIGGVMCIFVETTDRVLAERRLRTLRELATETANAMSADDVCARAAAVLALNPRDIPLSILFLTDRDGRPRLNCFNGVQHAPDPIRWPLQEAATTFRAQRVDDVAARLPQESGALPLSALVLPVVQPGTAEIDGYFIAGLSDLRLLDELYRGFLELVVGQIATAIAWARTREEERRRTQTLAELDAAKTAFFANISHEFRTPLTLLLAPLEDTLAQPGALSHVVRERLTLAHTNGLRLLRLVNTLLEFSRIEAGRVQTNCVPTDLAAFTADLASMFRSIIERAGLRFRVDCPLSRPAVVDRDMWEKIVLNLLSNAFKFTHEGAIEVTLREVGPDAVLTVCDTGVGIPEEELPRLFERFHRVRCSRGRSIEGTGIGLALVQELVKLHNGQIRAESAHGRGSTFVVSVPLGAAIETGDPNAALLQPPRTTNLEVAEAACWLPERPEAGTVTSTDGGDIAIVRNPRRKRFPQTGPLARVLVADDNADLRRYLGRLLAPNYEVELVGDGVAALNAARTRPPDLVLADVTMPGLDGFALMAALRVNAQTRTVPVVLLSARAGEESRIEGLAAGADDYLVKPFSGRELLARVGTHLELARVRREATQRESELLAEARQVQERATAAAIQKANVELELRVTERTQELHESNVNLEQQIAKRKQVEHARTELLHRVVRVQEEEHRRIARELHDDLTQRLALLAIASGAIEQQPECSEIIKNRARSMREQLIALSESVHALSRQLHPAILDDLGLVDALRSECVSLGSRDGITVRYRTAAVPADLPRDVVLCVYRVAQEALRNVSRHARCTWVSVWLNADERELVLRVRDRGVGFDPAARNGKGIGLASMSERARLIRGRLKVRSNPGSGTKITLRVPLPRTHP